MNYLILIKHAMPEIKAGVNARDWKLSRDGRSACPALAALIKPFSPEVFYTSDEPKAVETGRLAAKAFGFTPTSFPNLHEHDRTNLRFLDKGSFEKAVREFFARPSDLVMGQETANQALQRFSLAVETLLDLHPDQNIAIVAHGTVISLFTAHRTGQDAFSLWKSLDLPSFLVLPRPGLEEIIHIETEIEPGRPALP